MDPPLFRRRVDCFRQTRALDVAMAKRELGYQSKVDFTEGLSKTAQWYREQGYFQ
jgi:nucleoside-diphosphate-sugar epimerase